MAYVWFTYGHKRLGDGSCMVRIWVVDASCLVQMYDVVLLVLGCICNAFGNMFFCTSRCSQGPRVLTKSCRLP